MQDNCGLPSFRDYCIKVLAFSPDFDFDVLEDNSSDELTGFCVCSLPVS